VASNALRWYGSATVVVGVLFTASDFVALLVTTLNDPGEEAFIDAYAAWAALSLFTLALLQVALIGLYAPQRGTTGTLGWIGFLLAFVGTSITFLIVLVYAIVASPVTPADPGFLEAGPPGPFILYFPLFSLGWFLLGAAFLRSSAYPRPAALLLTLGAVLTLYPHPVTNVVFSAAVVWLGLALLLERDPSSEQP
jgi:hypothetical protein